jgi:hypothetical protein
MVASTFYGIRDTSLSDWWISELGPCREPAGFFILANEDYSLEKTRILPI